jgi:hypothetical protein
MVDDPHAELKREGIERMRRFHEARLDQQVNAQRRANEAAGAPRRNDYYGAAQAERNRSSLPVDQPPPERSTP